MEFRRGIDGEAQNKAPNKKKKWEQDQRRMLFSWHFAPREICDKLRTGPPLLGDSYQSAQ
jgi:hypothetical protein